MKPHLAFTICALAACASAAHAADEMSVQVKTTQVRDKDSYLGKTLYELHFGDRVTILQKGAAWFKIQPLNPPASAQTLVGYLNKSALTTKRVVLKADQNADMHASSDEVALAGKGFNDDVENTYKAEHPNLASAYTKLDAIETDPSYAPTPEEINAFRTEGQLTGGVS